MIETPDELWKAMSEAARVAEASVMKDGTGGAAPLPEAFAGCLVILIPADAPLAARVQTAFATQDATAILPAYPETCANCRFRRDKRCAVRAPEVFHPLGTVWPDVELGEWCGEWQALAQAEGATP